MRVQYLVSSLAFVTITLTFNGQVQGQTPSNGLPTLENQSPETQPNQQPTPTQPNQQPTQTQPNQQPAPTQPNQQLTQTQPNQQPAQVSPLEQPNLLPEQRTSRPEITDPYLLGPGDTIQLDVFEEEEFSGEQTILDEGSITLPLVGAIPLAGLTLEEASEVITEELSDLLRRPFVNVRLTRARPVRITIVGEVKRPGTYAVSPEDAGSVVQGQVLGARTAGTPTLSDVISLAGGIRETAQIRDVEIIRQQRGGGTRTINIDLWELLQSGGGEGNVTLRPDDRIVIPEAETITASEKTQLARSTFAPDEITVNIVGEVERPGRIEVGANTPLNQALLAAGGFDQERARQSDVTLIRLNDDGTVSEREIPVDFSEGVGDDVNPVLRDQDILVVERSGITRTSERLDTFTNPINSILNLLNIFF
ncbi:polysaccharide export protein [Euhalothece natronophila Z-M001]|uniref:Polysaccharide export protein n=1 Tax=Euhalothece natronophila Z-M001 TaxID=522448 RepID=A0A5B8NHX3_9CHRO|nr:polysaccharide biosynthesis/export family protein [Euhalothece natronophila]QDZ38558.1 polysaccharide export protein [Euhalothece natronophila Z-M001]